MFLKSNKMITGIDIGHYAVKYVSIDQSGDSMELIKAGYVRVEDYKSDQVNLSKTMENLTDKIGKKRGKVVSSVDNENLIVKKMRIPVMEREAVIETIRWEFSEYVPFSLDNSVIDYVVTAENENEIEITAVIIPRESVNSSLKLLKGFQVSTLNIQPFSLLNLFNRSNKPYPLMIIDLGHYSTQIIVGGKENIHLLRNLDFGTDDMREYQNGYEKNLTLVQEKNQTAYNTGNNIKQSRIEELKLEINRAINFFKKKSNGNYIEEVYLSGGGVYLSNLNSELNSCVDVECKPLNPFSNIEWNIDRIDDSYYENSFHSEYAVAAGLCISEVLADEG